MPTKSGSVSAKEYQQETILNTLAFSMIAGSRYVHRCCEAMDCRSENLRTHT